jgi:hypothetical protein
MKRITTVLTALILLAVLATTVAAAPTNSSSSPYFIVTRVDPNAYVYLRVYNFPQGTQVHVYMDLYGTGAVNGAMVGGFGADANTEFRLEMAKNIHGQERGDIRLQAEGINISGWFYNVAGGSSSTAPTPTPVPPSSGTVPGYSPTFSITNVVVDSTVTIYTYNFPPNDTFNVLMNTYGTQGVGGYQVATVGSASGGSLSYTFNIPSQLYGQSKIAIRLESPSSGYFAYNWFYNNTSSSSSGGSSSGEIVPVFWITGVVRDSTVTIQTTSLAPNFNYDVFMNYYGTKGYGGTKVATVSSGSGGVQVYTFNIPSYLYGQSRIAILLHNPSSGFFGYNWFWNNTHP